MVVFFLGLFPIRKGSRSVAFWGVVQGVQILHTNIMCIMFMSLGKQPKQTEMLVSPSLWHYTQTLPYLNNDCGQPTTNNPLSAK